MDDATSGYFKVALTTSSYTPSASTHTVIGDITNEVSGNGYARASVGNISFTESGGTATFDGDDAEFTASGGSITARYWVLFADGATGDPLIAYGLLDDTPDDVETTDGKTLTVEWSGSGILTLAKA